MRAPETGLTDTIFARHRMTGIMMSPPLTHEIRQPSEPEIPICSPDVTKIPIPIVPENAIASGPSISFYRDRNIDRIGLPVR